MKRSGVDKMDLVVLVLYAVDHAGRRGAALHGITRLEKLLFLLEKEGGLVTAADRFVFEPYRYGPFSSEVYDALAALQGWDLVDVRSRPVRDYYAAAEVERLDDELSDEEDDTGAGRDTEATGAAPIQEKVITLTQRGIRLAEKLAEKLSEEEQRSIARIKQKYGRMSLRHLIAYVYQTYPEYAVKSELI